MGIFDNLFGKKEDEAIDSLPGTADQQKQMLSLLETTEGTKSIQDGESSIKDENGQRYDKLDKDETGKYLEDFGGTISKPETLDFNSNKKNDNILHYSGTLGDFDYDSTQWALAQKEVKDDATGIASSIPILKYIGSEKDGNNIDIPDGLTSLDYSFEGSKIKSVPAIPDSVESTHCAFKDCSKCTEFSEKYKYTNISQEDLNEATIGSKSGNKLNLAGTAITAGTTVVGGIAGTALGTTTTAVAVGGTVGSVVPGLGTAIGAGVGAVVGTIGNWVGNSATRKQEQLVKNTTPEESENFKDTSGMFYNSGMKEAYSNDNEVSEENYMEYMGSKAGNQALTDDVLTEIHPEYETLGAADNLSSGKSVSKDISKGKENKINEQVKSDLNITQDMSQYYDISDNSWDFSGLENSESLYTGLSTILGKDVNTDKLNLDTNDEYDNNIMKALAGLGSEETVMSSSENEKNDTTKTSGTQAEALAQIQEILDSFENIEDNDYDYDYN